MSVTIIALEAHDVRFPTSTQLHGSDAMNPEPDYSAAVCVLKTSADGLEGHGLAFTIGRGNDICVAAIKALAPFVVGLTLEEIQADMGAFWRRVVGDSQIRWLGPEKGVVHLAGAAVINAAWDLWGKAAEKPVWRLVADMSPREIVRLIDFRHITDVLAPEEALDRLTDSVRGLETRLARMRERGLAAYDTTPGWLGYSDERLIQLCREAAEKNWAGVKLKVGQDRKRDLERCAIARETLDPRQRLMIDANQVWEVSDAIAHVKALAGVNPWWIEEPTSPDDILGHRKIADAVRPIRVATGEHCHNRVMFKQFLEADAIDVVQVDACRLGGLNENLAVLLLAAKYDKPVCPHAGGVGLCQYVQHIGAIDALVIGGERDDRMIEHAGHLHEHFVTPLDVRDGAYRPTSAPGFSVEFRAESVALYAYPDGAYWARRRADA
ncbi:MAG TPA: enolase C-terminal domain-like protein [Caulobacterales bacterium]|nr:enolase C-terminal domain-like protein [Caulobacterales bacterium]